MRTRTSRPVAALFLTSVRGGSGLAALALALAAGCRSSGSEEPDGVPKLIRYGRFEEALALAEQEAESRPADGEAQELYLHARIAWILDRGRRAVFAEEPEEALALFLRALDLDPEHPTTITWILKTRRQLAEEWLDRANDLTDPERLDEALAAYERALSYDPDEVQAKAGISRILLVMNYRAGLSKSYYDEGLRTFRELLLHPARRNFGLSHDYNPEEPRSHERRERVDSMLADERTAQAAELELQGLFFAARNEYRLALLVEPDHPEAREGFDRMDREVRAVRKVAEADMDIRRGELDKARPRLEEASRLTEAQKEDVSLREAQIEEARFQAMYDQARAYERDYDYPRAVAAYEELLEEAEVFSDTKVRKDTIEWLIQRTETLYAKAAEAATEEEAYQYYFEINELIWPEYRDVEARLAELEPRVHPPTEEREAGEDDGADG